MTQVWLPLPSFKDSLKTLSDKDLGQQRIDVINLMESFHEVTQSQLAIPQRKRIHSTEPIYKMWYGYEMQLCEYGLEACDEYDRRFDELMPRGRYYDIIAQHLDWATGEEADMDKPDWFGDVDVHLSHQAALVRSDPDWYSRWYRVDTSLALEWRVSSHAQT